ncbi:MAG: hypothetical protein ACOCMX_06320 [Acetivibrio ethanolgignens]
MTLHCLKKLAVATAVTLLVTALPVMPAAETKAAAVPAFATYRKTLYENGSFEGVYTYTVKNIRSGYTVQWSLAGEGAAYAEWDAYTTTAFGRTASNEITISTTGDIDAKNSSLTVVAKVYDTYGRLVKTIKDNVTLKIQATSVAIKTNKISSGLSGLAVGGSYDFDRTIKPYNSTSKTYWKVTDASGTDLSSEINSSGIFTPTREGTYSITAICRNSRTSKELCRNTVTAVVGTQMSSLTQTAVNKFDAVFTSDMSKKLTADSFTIKEGNGLASVLPKSVTFSADGKTATVTTYTNFKNGASYTVTLGNTTKTFTASAGEVTRIAILTESVPANVATPIEYALYDAKGIDVSAIARGTVEFTANLTNGYLTVDNQLFLTTLGKGGTVTVTYSEGMGKLTATKNIICREAEAITAVSNDFTITASSSAPDFSASTYKANTTISIGDTGYAHFRALDKNNRPINYTRITYASSDDNTLIIEGSGRMLPIKEGRVVVIVSAFEGSVETTYTFSVTVQPAKKLSSLGLSTASMTMSNCGDMDYKKYVDVIPLDQFGNKIDPKKCSITVSETYNRSFASYDAATGRLVLSVPYGTTATTYTLTVTAIYNGVTAAQKLYLTVVNVPASTAVAYVLEMSTGSNTVDISMNNGDKIENKTVYAKLAKYQGGVFAGYSYFDSAAIMKDGKYYSSDLTIAGSSNKPVNSLGNVSLPIILAKVADVNGTKVIQKAETGTYSIIATLDGKQYPLGLTVTDRDNAPSVAVRSTTSSVSLRNALELVKDCLTIPAGYEIIDCTAVGTAASGAAIPVSPGSKLHIQTVTLRSQITLANADGSTTKAYTTYTIPVGQTLTNK